jgi:hypothetical protein
MLVKGAKENQDGKGFTLEIWLELPEIKPYWVMVGLFKCSVHKIEARLRE